MLFSLSALAQEEESLSPSSSPSEAYAGSQIERHDFDEKKWESLKQGIDYSKQEKPKEKESKEQQPKEPPRQDKGLGPFFKVLALVVGVGLLILIIVSMAKGENLFAPKNSKLKPTVSASELEKIEENLHEAELNDPIKRAVAAGDYPMAVRLYYLALLKELSLRNHIRWKREKTNGAYLRELAGLPLFATVQEATLAFERVWYGKVELTKPDFDQLEIKFKKAVATITA